MNEQPKEEGINVSRVKLDQILAELVETRKKNEDLIQRLERVEYAADKGRTSIYDSRNKDKQFKRVHLTGWGDKVVLAWKTIFNDVEQNPNNGVWSEKQIVKLFLNDDTTEEIDIRNFSRRRIALWGDVIKDITDDVKDERVLTIKLDGGKGEFTLPVTFVNY